eukprot:s3125_g3.t1
MEPQILDGFDPCLRRLAIPSKEWPPGTQFHIITKKAGANRREPPKGICHVCRAGQDGVPYEQIQTRRPIWLQTMHQQLPFTTPSPFLHLDHVPNEEANIWAFDLFHCLHLGVARNFIGSVLAMYSNLEQAGNIDETFALLSARYRSFCSQQRLGSVLTKITKESIQWPTTGCFPSAAWHKGAVSTVMMKWIEHRFLHEDLSEEPWLPIAGQACVAINKAAHRSTGGSRPRHCSCWMLLLEQSRSSGRRSLLVEGYSRHWYLSSSMNTC